jgi:hypothetical protein
LTERNQTCRETYDPAVSFHSRRRLIVFPQAEHARFAAVFALAWAEPPPLPLASFVRGVADHDRGYGEHDDYDIDTVDDSAWIEIQRRGFAPRGEDAVVDLVAALHVRRLLSGNDPVATAEADEVITSLLPRAGVSREQADAADAVTNVCDVISFQFCFEAPSDREVRGYRVLTDGEGGVGVEPWPFRLSELVGVVTAFERDGYPELLVPVVVPFQARP